MVRHVFRMLTGDQVETRLIACSDDTGTPRKVHDDICNEQTASQVTNVNGCDTHSMAALGSLAIALASFSGGRLPLCPKKRT
jgi:hypothetical protein